MFRGELSPALESQFTDGPSTDTMENLFFDLDRTLWDFDRNSAQTLQELYSEFGLKELGCETFGRFVEVYKVENQKCWDAYLAGRMSQAELRPARYANTLQKLGIDKPGLGRDLGEQYVARSPRQRNLIPGALEVLGELKGRGHRIIILTNGFDEVQRIKVDNSGIAPFVDRVLTSDELGYKKPDPRCFEAAFEKTGCTAGNTWMIGDDFHADIRGAAAVGMRQIFFSPEGLAPGDHPPATVQIAALSELIDCL
jgi:putative hydrolase of the HAD superfamily